MSWIFALFLCMYGLVRTVLWIRGQIRYQLVKDLLPVPARARPVPEHLPPRLARFYAATDELRVRLVDDLRQISIVMVTDPDAPLGQVRDSRFRWAVLDAWLRIRHWRRALELAPDGRVADHVLLYEDHGLGSGPVDRCAELMRPTWWQAVRARRLDPFLIADVRVVRGSLARLVDVLEGWQERLDRAEFDPYRGSAARTAQAPMELAG